MKNQLRLFFCVFVIFFTTQAYGQKFGVRSGINLSSVGFGGGESELYANAAAMRSAATYGGYINLKIVPLLSLQLEGNYDPKGFVFDTPPVVDATFEGTYYQHYNYFTLPLLLKVNLLAFHVEAGPYLGLLMSAREVKKGTLRIPDLAGGYLEETYDEDTDLKPLTQKTDFGIAAGMGLTFNLGPAQLVLGARYNHGLSNILREPGEAFDKMTHRNFTIYGGAAIGF